jgi:lipoprotein-releasing system permease protein
MSIALRYLRGDRARSISFISQISALGIVIGIATLIVAQSVFNGFEREVRARVLDAVSHVTVTPFAGVSGDWRELGERLRHDAEVAAYAPFLLEQSMLARGKTVRAVLVRGILPEAENRVSNFAAAMQAGRLEALEPGASGIVVGSAIAEALKLELGAPVLVVVPQSESDRQPLPRFQRFNVVGIFRMDLYEYDNGLVLMHLDDAARLYRIPGAVSGLRLKLVDVDRAPAVARAIERGLGGEYRVRDWSREHVNYFKALQMQKSVIFLILLLIVAVAMFNVASTLVILVSEKKGDIAILRTIGSSRASIMWVFVIYGAVLGLLGTLAGTALGVALAYNAEAIFRGIEQLFNTSFLAADVYFISELPSDLRWRDVAWVAGATMVLALVSALYPARRAARALPAEALRYE